MDNINPQTPLVNPNNPNTEGADPDPFYNPNQQTNNKPSKEKKPGIHRGPMTIVIVIGLAVLVFGFLNMKETIYQPFNLDLSDTSDEDAMDLEEALIARNKDTDGDGLSDYDEDNIYYTSPFLEDSDSDGTSDKDEIEAGTDPNCSGDQCAAYNPVGTTDDANGTADVENINPEALREALRNSGVPEEIIVTLNDQDLLKMYQDSVGLNKAIKEGAVDETGKTLSQEELEQLRSLSAEEIRKLLIDGGAPAEEINQLSDQDVIDAFFQILRAQGVDLDE